MKWRDSFHPYAVCTILLWSLAYVLTRLALYYFSALPLGLLRYAVASLVLLPVCVAAKVPLPKKRDIPWFAASGAAGFFLYMVAFNIGTSTVTAATSSLVIASVPVFTALLATVFFKEKLQAYQWVAIAIEFAGILVLTLYGSVFSANRGVLWLLLAALLLSVYNLLQRRLTKTYPALHVTAYSVFFGTAMLLVFAPVALAELRGAPPVQLVYLLVLGAGCGAVAYIAWSKAMEKAPKTSLVSNYMFFTPFVTGVLGFWLAGELPEASTLAGGACIILGALLFNQKSLRRGR